MERMHAERCEEAKFLECLREQLLGKGIVVDERLLWSGNDLRPNSDLTQIKSRPSETESEV